MSHSATILVILAVIACLVGVEGFQPLSEERGKRQILMGTKWCGTGNEATNYNDLGFFVDTDRCCRDHDHCKIIIPIEGTAYGLKNDSPLKPILHCDCDEEFRRCLKKINGFVSYSLGKLYFRIMDKCIKEEHPIIKCEHYSSNDSSPRCDKYLVDEKRPKVYQFINNLQF